MLELVPATAESNHGSDSGGGNAESKHNLEAVHVAVDDNGNLLCRKRVADVGSASQNESALVDFRCSLHDIVDHLVHEGGLGGRDEESSSKALEDCKVLVKGFF